jgi:pyruvate/2-oxoglutarate/acetoin dehydrogenase E1 component
MSQEPNDTSFQVEIEPREQEHGVAQVRIEGDTVTVVCICGIAHQDVDETKARKKADTEHLDKHTKKDK